MTPKKGKKVFHICGLHRVANCFLPRRRYASVTFAMDVSVCLSVCLSVCHKLVLCQNGCTDRDFCLSGFYTLSYTVFYGS